jgi:hypothetical protein
LPKHAVAITDRARYRATIGTAVTPWLKLSRQLVVTGLHPNSSDLEVGGKLARPFKKGESVTVTTQSDCSAAPTVVGHVKVASNGTFYRVLAIPVTDSGFVVRLTAKIKTSNGSQATTYSIARPVQVR